MIRRLLAAGALLLGITAMGSGAAHALPANLVASDQIRFTGIAAPTSATSTAFVLKSTQCVLLSDGTTASGASEPPVPCAKTAQFTVLPSGGAVGSAMVSSPDGVVRWSFTLSPPIPGTTLRSMSGRGVEFDRGEPGQPTPRPYACFVQGSLTVTPIPGGLSISGSITILESPTAP